MAERPDIWYTLGPDRNVIPVQYEELRSVRRKTPGSTWWIVAKTRPFRDVEVSTVFLEANHRFDDGPPLVFETLVLGGPLADECERYSTWDEAEVGHAAMVARVRDAGTRYC